MIIIIRVMSSAFFSLTFKIDCYCYYSSKYLSFSIDDTDTSNLRHDCFKFEVNPRLVYEHREIRTYRFTEYIDALNDYA